jgi:hypothetical protein
VRTRRRAGTPALVEAVADALSKITPDDIVGWFAKCGYGVQC